MLSVRVYYILLTIKYTVLYVEVLSHRFCSEVGSGVFLQNSDTLLPLDCFQL